jgi:hypothetical protein
MLGAHVFKQSTCKPAYCNVSVSVVHDDYWSDVEAALEKRLMRLDCTGPSVTLGSPPYYESAEWGAHGGTPLQIRTLTGPEPP